MKNLVLTLIICTAALNVNAQEVIKFTMSQPGVLEAHFNASGRLWGKCQVKGQLVAYSTGTYNMAVCRSGSVYICYEYRNGKFTEIFGGTGGSASSLNKSSIQYVDGYKIHTSTGVYEIQHNCAYRKY